MTLIPTLSRHPRIVAGVVGGVAAAGLVVTTALPAHADVERHGRYGAGAFEFNVDREDRGFEVSFDLDHVAPGSRWVVALRHEGKLVVRRTLTAHRDDDDGKGELSLERWRPDTAGADTFSVRFRQAGTAVYKTAKIRVR